MWTTLITTVTAAAVCLSMISLATQLRKQGVTSPRPMVERSVEQPRTS
jgi:hypothetical protein